METHINPRPLDVVKGTDFQKIVPFLWFDNQAEEAANFYASVFKNARVKTITHYNAESANAVGVPENSVMTVSFQVEGMDFTAINGGPVYKITPAISFMVNCRTHEKIDDLWCRLSEGGIVRMELDKYPFSEKYGWVEDKFGVSWQLILGNDTQIISPCIMFTGEQRGKCEEAINFYMSVFENSAVERIERYTEEDPGPTGLVKYSAFSLNGQKFKAMDNGNDAPFLLNPAISFVVNCHTQQEIDHFWNELTRGGDESSQMCGWLADRYGVSWQVVPDKVALWTSDTGSEGGRRFMKAMMQMKKLDMNVLQAAYEGEGLNEREAHIDFEETGTVSDANYGKGDTLTPNEEL
jgi:predicted 3-demethylubiquinone-9 3-methyltransferase (glyoxalase superfamily)